MTETVNDYEDLLEESEHRWRNRLIGLVVLAALIAAGAYALWALVLSGGDSSGEETQTATVQRGSITNTLSTSGVVVAQSTAELSFGQSGLVTAVNVTLGQEVNQGDVLAEMESGELESALVTAEVNLASAQAKLVELLEGSSESDLASADQSLLQAQASYDQAESALEDLLDGPSESELLSAELAVALAESQLASAEESRTNLYSTAEEAVTEAEDALADAKRTASSAADSIVLAKASLWSAAEAYCNTDDHIFDICADFSEKFSIPLSSQRIKQLSDSISPEEDPDAALISATTSLISANSSYKSALASKTSADAAVVSAEADIEEAKKGPSSAEIASADVAVAEAQLSLDEANEKLAELIEGPTQDDVEEAQSNLDQAAAALVVVQAKWDDVYDGPDPLDIELERDKVRQAELSVEQAREDLEDAQIVALFDGTVAALNIEVGQMVAAQETAVILNTPDALRLRLTITESDVLDVEAGQSGIATFDAIGETPFPFLIDSVGTNPVTTMGVVTYEAWAKVLSAPAAVGATGTAPRGQAILATAAELLGMTEEELQTALQSGQTMAELAEAQGMSAEEFQAALMEQAGGAATPQAGAPDTGDIPAEALERFAGIADTDADAKPLPGMNASVTITVGQAQDVLIVPAQAIQTEGFRSVVEVQNDDGSTERVVVQTGLSDGMNTEITEGLEEGQTIIIPGRAATAVEATTGGEFQQRGFQFEGELPEGGGPTFEFFSGPGGSAP